MYFLALTISHNGYAPDKCRLLSNYSLLKLNWCPLADALNANCTWQGAMCNCSLIFLFSSHQFRNLCFVLLHSLSNEVPATKTIRFIIYCIANNFYHAFWRPTAKFPIHCFCFLCECSCRIWLRIFCLINVILHRQLYSY